MELFQELNQKFQTLDRYRDIPNMGGMVSNRKQGSVCLITEYRGGAALSMFSCVFWWRTSLVHRKGMTEGINSYPPSVFKWKNSTPACSGGE